MESTTKNKIRDIVRLHQILKKWKKLASSSSSKSSTSCNPSHSSNTPTSSTTATATAPPPPPPPPVLLSSSSSKSCIDYNNTFHDDQPDHEKPAAASTIFMTKSSIISRRPATKFLKKTLSFSSLDNCNSTDHQVAAVPKGYLAVLCVGREAEEDQLGGGEINNMIKKRFVIPTSYLAHQAFALLLQQAEEEFGFQQDGILKIPCDVPLFHNILNTIMISSQNQSSSSSSSSSSLPTKTSIITKKWSSSPSPAASNNNSTFASFHEYNNTSVVYGGHA